MHADHEFASVSNRFKFLLYCSLASPSSTSRFTVSFQAAFSFIVAWQAGATTALDAPKHPPEVHHTDQNVVPLGPVHYPISATDAAVLGHVLLQLLVLVFGVFELLHCNHRITSQAWSDTPVTTHLRQCRIRNRCFELLSLGFGIAYVLFPCGCRRAVKPQVSD